MALGACIGLNATFLNIITEWLSDIKLGHCSTAFYLNEKFCCWGAEESMSLSVINGRVLTWVQTVLSGTNGALSGRSTISFTQSSR
jgi:hypothetical protein